MKIKTSAFFIISEWNNDVSWIKDYTENYLVYDKSNTLPEDILGKVIKRKNVGYNVGDYFNFFIENYDNLPSVMALLEGCPWDHITREKFDKLINNNEFTPLESYEHIPETWINKKGEDGGFTEYNNNWYISAHVQTHGSEVNRYLQSYNQFLFEVFENPVYPKYIRFSPGGQYIVKQENILFYSKKFWNKLLKYVDYTRVPSEGHIIERALYTIFTNKFKERKDL